MLPLSALAITLAMTPSAASSLWFEQPAPDWNSALPIGNGRLGAMVFGGVAEERFQLNEDTFWAGVPHDYSVPGSSTHLAEIRRLIFDGKESEATALADKSFMGSPKFQAAYQPLGDLVLRQPDGPAPSRYRRQLDLRTGIHESTYRRGDATFRLESFVSHPDQVLAIRIEADRPGQIDLNVQLSSLFANQTVAKDGQIVVRGQWKDDGVRKDWTAQWDAPGIRFATAVRAILEGGHATPEGDGLRIRGANSVVLLLAAGTSFVNYRDISADPDARWPGQLDRAAKKGYVRLRDDHVKDFASLMDRSALELPATPASAKPTDQRLLAAKQGADDPALAALYYHFGRYLLASSSRPGDQPANLQGLWNKDANPAWGSKYTSNINLQMNYWPADVANLSECADPLFAMMDDLRVTGAKTARDYYGARGWVLHHNTDLWRGAAPVDGVWGVWPMASAWLARHAWERYAFTQDRRFLKDRGWPQMREAARFLLDFLVEAPSGTPWAGKLVTNPSHSPENAFTKPNGERSMFTYAATMDLEIARDLFDGCLAAIDVLKSAQDAALRNEIAAARAKLASIQVSPKTGRLQEWIEDYAEPEPGHRHMSHLYGLYPGHVVSVTKTPELAVAARKSLEHRLANGGGGTGWSRAWLVSLFARLHDGDQAAAHLQTLLAKSTQPNLLDSHPPFQIDGNFAGCAGIAEMLLQSHDEEPGRGYVLRLLPALPKAWPDGRVVGLRARGGFVVDVAWTDGRPVAAGVKGKPGSRCVVLVGDERFEVEIGPQGAWTWDAGG